MKIYIYLIITCLVITGCKENVKKENDSNIINLDKYDNVSVFDLFSKIEIIPLETDKESVMHPLFILVKPINELYYVLDLNQEAFFIYSQNGEFLRKIHQPGQGPEDFSNIVDFGINRFTGNIEMLSGDRYLQIYDKEISKHIERISLNGKVFHSFKNLTDDIYVFFSDYSHEDHLYFYSKKQNKYIASTYKFDPDVIGKSGICHNFTPFYMYNDVVRFSQGYNGDIFTVNDSKLRLDLTYSWDFGENTIDESVVFPFREEMTYYRELRRKGSYKYAMGFTANGENDNYFITNFLFKGKSHSLILDKKENKTYVFDSFKEGVNCSPYLVNNTAMYVWAPPEYIHMFVNENILDEDNRRKLESITDDENPIVVKYYFK